MTTTPHHIAIVHSDFDPGSVTDTVRSHVECLCSANHQDADTIGKVVLLSGNRVAGLNHATFDGTETIQIGGLDDDRPVEPLPPESTGGLKGFRRAASGHASLTGRNLFERVDGALRRAGMQPGNCVVHWHNASLGRNAAIPFAVAHLANAGWCLLLQIHDLEADQKPENIRHLLKQTGATRAATLDAIRYPVHENIAYAHSIATGKEPPEQYAMMTSWLASIPSIERFPPGDRAEREAAVDDVLRATI
ncbi:hypothetical protein [Allorhodopirellula solitaria]|uniref:Uncharacterized protein n=1 Tax=Allorhodopirellula solitaria TaxID=2527987 RepID=A0A5C5X138_9BACT|nr:hypothetical protein [Allorhodopirellula solitaria]TWT56011.1 hypothetical protein CA85_46020 [Allorhodopirellula solitaria]